MAETVERTLEQISLKVDTDLITLNELIELEENPSARFLRDWLARWAYTPEGEPIPEDEAQSIIGNLPLNKLQAIAQQVGQEVRRQQRNTIPPKKGAK